MALIFKIIAWIAANGASVFALAQALVKAAKELATAVFNVLSLFLPAETTKKLVAKVRAIFNAIDAGLEFIKKWLLKQ